VAALRRAGHRVRALALPQARRDHVEAFVDEWQTGDQGDPIAVAGLVAGAGAIIHIAIDWTALNAGAIPTFERNLLSSLRLLEAARVASGPLWRIELASPVWSQSGGEAE
jgi:nucleoside-diphosphate-sugar epimerase